MTSDALVELEGLVPRMNEAILGRKLGASLDRAVTRLGDAARQAERFEALVTAGRILGADRDQHAREPLEEAVCAVEDMTGLLQRAATVEDLERVYREFPDVLTALKALETAVRALWRGVVQSDFVPLVAVGQILTQIGDLAELGSRLERLGREAQRTVEVPVPSETIATEMRRLRSSRDRLDAELHAVTGETEVDRFLTAVTAGGATLSDVTPKVLQWLTNHQALSAFRINGNRQ